MHENVQIKKMKKSLFYILLLLPLAVFAQLNKQNPQIDKIDILHYRFELKLSDTSDILIARTTVTLNNLEKIPGFISILCQVKMV